MTAPGNGAGRWRQARRNPKVVTGIAILVLFGLVVVAHPVLQSTIWAGQDRLYDPVIGFDHLIVHPSTRPPLPGPIGWAPIPWAGMSPPCSPTPPAPASRWRSCRECRSPSWRC